jgi:hypothetical protein
MELELLEYLPKDLITHIIAPYCEPCLSDYNEQIRYLNPLTSGFKLLREEVQYGCLHSYLTELAKIKILRWYMFRLLKRQREKRIRIKNHIFNKNKYYKI